ncbi:ABC transporter permease [Kribbella sp. CA-245084]|uniref:ABC transporter permease n=1 Tax=Kribbella sp. CA-245084 TaxID=3239940 RepID=UPI003D94198C
MSNPIPSATPPHQDKRPRAPIQATKSPMRRAARRFIRQPAGLVGSALLGLYILAAIFAPLISPKDPLATNPSIALHPLGGGYLLGSDPLGRDVLSRIIYGTRPALTVGISAVLVGLVLGCLSGMLAGYLKGRVGGIIMRFWDGVFAVPAILLGLTLAAAFGSSVAIASIAVGLASAPGLARVAYAAVLAELERGYIEAAHAQGLRPARIFLRHLLPNALSPMVVQLALTFSLAVLLESAFSFLGIGLQPPAPSWGAMLADSRSYLSTGWWYGVFPGLAITGLVLALNFCADAARDALDPRTP